MMTKMLVQGRDRDGEVVTYGEITCSETGVTHARTNAQNPQAAKIMKMVTERKILDASLQPMTPEWFKKLPYAYTGSMLWCTRG